MTATPASGVPGYDVTLTATCTPGESVTFELDGAETTARCDRSNSTGLQRPSDDASGIARVETTAPSSLGEHRGTVRGSSESTFGSFLIRVVSPAGLDASNGDRVTVGGTDVGHELELWPVVLAMSAVMLFMLFQLQRPLQLSPRR